MLSNLAIALALGRPQHYFGAADKRMRQGARSRQTLQLGAFVHGQFKDRFGASGELNSPWRKWWAPSEDSGEVSLRMLVTLH